MMLLDEDGNPHKGIDFRDVKAVEEEPEKRPSKGADSVEEKWPKGGTSAAKTASPSDDDDWDDDEPKSKAKAKPASEKDDSWDEDEPKAKAKAGKSKPKDDDGWED
jgi:hypothetical protein